MEERPYEEVQALAVKEELLKYAKDLQKGELSGNDLKQKVESGMLSKQERRKITRMAKKLAGESQLTERQKLRREVREKKMMPKPDKEQRRRKYLEGIDRRREIESAKFSVCLGCRKRGHILKDCPNKPILSERKGIHICYFCGSKEHSLKNCSTYNGDDRNLPFAKCFICNETGHLSRNCSSNTHGLYPKGGSCHICGEMTHLAKNCPKREEE